MAPEQAGGVVLGPPADVWGIGALLYEATSGRRPFEESPRVKYPQLDGRAQPVAALRRLPQGLARAIDACLEREPRLRPSVPELAAALRAFA